MLRRGFTYKSSRDRRGFIQCDGYIKIPLGIDAKDGYATVDSEYKYLAKDNWRKSFYGYAIRSKDKKLLHRAILQPDKREAVDHINNDKLDNTLSNLRICNQQQNSWNQVVRKNNQLGVKGVSKSRTKYRARIRVSGKQMELGIFDDLKAAAMAYNRSALKFFGEFAKLNEYGV